MTNRVSQDLQILNRISRALAETTDVQEVKSIRDQAEAVRHYARNAALGFEIQNQAAEVKLRAERRAGELLTKMVSRGGDRKSNSQRESLILADLGIDHNQSARWQREAAVPAEIFEEYVRSGVQSGREVTSQGLLKLGKELAQSKRSSRPSQPAHNGNGHHPGETLSPKNANTATAAEVIAEMQNHWELLSSVLQPVLDGRTEPLKLAERRLLKRLLKEIKNLHESLGSLSQSGTNGVRWGGEKLGTAHATGRST